MLRSLFSGVTGLRSHQTRLDVIANNIANVNTVGYKSARVTFQDLMSQTLQGASAPQNGRGGTNPMQVGLGVQLGTIDTRMKSGSPQNTGMATDLALSGDGFFMVSDGQGQTFYTRAGNFNFDHGRLTYGPNGYNVLGWVADSTGAIDRQQEPEALQLAVNQQISPEATTELSFVGNLDARYTPGETISAPVEVYDSLGNLHTVTVTYEPVAGSDDWTYTVTWDGPGGPVTENGTLTFDADGQLVPPPTNPDFTFDPGGAGLGADPVIVQLDFSNVTQFGEDAYQETPVANGHASGTLKGFTIDPNGVITGVYSNGLKRALGQVALAEFPNAGGLKREGGTLFSESPNSGSANIGAADTGGLGTIIPGALEMSNVDLSRAFTNMIITQRGFQANSRVITTSDEVLQELVNLKR